MASISSPPAPPNLYFPNPKFSSPFPLKATSLHFASHPHSLSADATALCRCLNNASGSPSPSDNSVNRRLDSFIQDLIRSGIKRFDSYLNSLRDETRGAAAKAACSGDKNGSDKENLQRKDEEDWDWDRWWKHFQEVDEQERLVSILKSQLTNAVSLEDYKDAARLKVAIAAASTNDSVGKVMSRLNRAIKEEQYSDAALLTDKAGAGLVGWWSGISKDVNDPHGLIIRITPEHGRYVARSYSPRQLATSAAGVPLFEVFLTVNKKGEHKLKAVYLKRRRGVPNPPIASPKALGASERLSSVETPGDKSELFVVSTEDPESGDDKDDGSDPAEGMPGFQNLLKDMIPGVKVKVLKVTAPEKVDKDLISKVIEQMIEEEEDDEEEEEEEEEEEKENDSDSLEMEDVKSESDQEGDDDLQINAGPETIGHEEQNEIAVKVVIGGLVQKLSSNFSTRELLRVPAKLENKDCRSFSFIVEKETNPQDGQGKGKSSSDKSAKIQGRRSVDHVMFDLAKFIGRGKVPSKVLKDVGELISLTLNQAQNHQPLSGSTTFNRIVVPSSLDPLNGLYIGTHGLYSSEVIQLKHRFGNWKEEGGAKESSDLEFFEYVEALKLTGDPYVPAGQVAFRAKVGKMYELPHKGVLPEEFGVIARYKGQGRLAEPGFRNPRWVDGELVILNGKFAKGPVVGFVYWAPEYHFLVFFNQLKLQT